MSSRASEILNAADRVCEQAMPASEMAEVLRHLADLVLTEGWSTLAYREQVLLQAIERGVLHSTMSCLGRGDDELADAACYVLGNFCNASDA